MGALGDTASKYHRDGSLGIWLEGCLILQLSKSTREVRGDFDLVSVHFLAVLVSWMIKQNSWEIREAM